MSWELNGSVPVLAIACGCWHLQVHLCHHPPSGVKLRSLAILCPFMGTDMSRDGEVAPWQRWGGGHFYLCFHPWWTNKQTDRQKQHLRDRHTQSKGSICLAQGWLDYILANKRRDEAAAEDLRMSSSREGLHHVFLSQIWWFSSWVISDAVSLLAKGLLTSSYRWIKRKSGPLHPQGKTEPRGPTYRFRSGAE